jgi:dimethylargininase
MNTVPRTHRRAIVRGVPDTFGNCIQPAGDSQPVDVESARAQHAAYCDTLERLGLELVRLEADDRFPDCCFVEDAAIVVGDLAIICEMGAVSRRGEEEAVAATLSEHRQARLAPPATIDGGDAIHTGDKLLVGITERTNLAAVRQLDRILAAVAVDVVPVPVKDVLHLKSACTPLAPGLVLISDRFAAAEAFAEYERLIVPAEEDYAANCLWVNGTAVVSRGYPRTKAAVESRGFPTVALDMSEFRKCGGSLTCLSILL